MAKTDQGNAVFVRPIGSDKVVPIFIGFLEAQSILLALGKIPMPRPLTHDLFVTMLNDLDLKVERIEIQTIKDNTYYSKIFIKSGEKTSSIDARPSDALGIAIRANCPIFVDESVVKQTALSVTDIEDAVEISVLQEEKARIEEELQKAVDGEEYELAAELRDRLNEILKHFQND